MSGTIVWRKAGVVLLMWLLVTVLGIVLFIVSSQFRNAGYVKVTDGKVTNYEVDAAPCNKGSGTCYDSYAHIRYDYPDSGPPTGFCLLYAGHNSNSTQAYMIAENMYPLGMEFEELFRDKGTEHCDESAKGDDLAIAGTVLLLISGSILLFLPLYYPYLLASVTTTGEVMLPSKVQVSEMVAPTTALTKKEEIELKQAQVLAKARTKSFKISAKQRQAEADDSAGGWGMGKLFAVGV